MAGPTQPLCHCRAEEGSDVEEDQGRAGGAPGAWNVNWEDCFNKPSSLQMLGEG